MATTAITTKVNGLESVSINVEAQNASIKLKGIFSLNSQKVVISGNGEFRKVDDDSHVGNFNKNVNRFGYTDIEENYLNDCVNLLKATITDIEVKAEAGSITI